jgi:hypothetical protein
MVDDILKAKKILAIYEECMKLGGIFLVQPEHILSFKLMGLEKLCAGKTELAKVLLDSQRWLEENARDILVRFPARIDYPCFIPRSTASISILAAVLYDEISTKY